jgi:acyl-CoA thioesterase
MAAFSAPAMISTMTWMIDILDHDALRRPGWRLLTAEAETMREGYSAQAMGIWAEDGAAIALARQTIAIFT